MIYSYEEENDPPDLSPLMIDIEDKNGRPQKMYSVAFCGKRPKDYTPTKVGKAYKLMLQTAEDFAALPVKDLLSGKDLRQYLQTKNVR